MSEELEYYLKFSVPFLIICASIFNLTLNLGNKDLWVLLLCTCMAYLMPSPEVRKSIKTIVPPAPIVSNSNTI